jgi:hypothetical protein
MRITALATTALALGLATGCTGQSGRDTTPPVGLGHDDLSAQVNWHVGPPVASEPMRERGRSHAFAASWVSGAARLLVTVWGSGSCPSVASSALVSPDGRTVRLSLRSYPADRPCTADFAPGTSVVTMPSGITPAKRTRVVLADPAGKRWSILVKR